jgi:hypothetical protein
VKGFIWENFVLPNQTHNLGLVNLPSGHAVQEAVMDHMLPYIFGNIAIIGTSGNDAWPNINIRLPQFRTIEGQQQIKWDGVLNHYKKCWYSPFGYCSHVAI